MPRGALKQRETRLPQVFFVVFLLNAGNTKWDSFIGKQSSVMTLSFGSHYQMCTRCAKNCFGMIRGIFGFKGNVLMLLNFLFSCFNLLLTH